MSNTIRFLTDDEIEHEDYVMIGYEKLRRINQVIDAHKSSVLPFDDILVMLELASEMSRHGLSASDMKSAILKKYPKLRK